MDKLSTHQLHKFLHILPGFTQQARILLAVSGGVDSVVMTYLLASANYTIGIAHVNFQLRDGDAEKDEAFVKNLATSLNVPFFTTSVDTKKYASANKLSIEEAARNIRYQWLEEIRIQNSYDFIATAHHLNDHAETMLMHLTSGTGLQGMHGIRARNGNIIRPLLFATREQIETYASEHQLTFCTDVTNNSDVYLRNAFRKQVIPFLQQTNPSFLQTMATNAQHFREAHLLADERAVMLLHKWLKTTPTAISLPIKPITNHPAASTLLHTWLAPFGFTHAQITELATQQHVSGKQFLTNTHRLIVDRKHFLLTSYPQVNANIQIIENPSGSYHIKNGKLKIEKMAMHPNINLQASNNIAYFDADKIEFPLTLRVWQKGDYMYPLGLFKKGKTKPGKKKISDILTDARIAIPEKENTFVLCSGEYILWLIGIRSDERFRVSNNTTNVLKISMLPD